MKTALAHTYYSKIEYRMFASYCMSDVGASIEHDLFMEAFDLAKEINSKPLRIDDLLAIHRPKCGRGGMVDTLVLGTSSVRSEGSSPFARTNGYNLVAYMDEMFVAEMLREGGFVADTLGTYSKKTTA